MTRRARGEGSLYQSGGKWWASVSYHDEYDRLRLRRRSARTQAEAVTLLRELQAGEHAPVKTAPGTVGAWLDSWLETAAAPALRPSTYRRHEGIVRFHLKPALGHLTLTKVEPRHVSSLLTAKSRAGLAPKTVQHIRNVLSSALAEAEREGYVQRNVARLARGPRLPQPEAKTITTEQARGVLDVVQGDRLEALYVVALSLGLRQGEALGLRWSDVDLDNGTLAVRRVLQKVEGEYQFLEPKTPRSRRTVALPFPVAGQLRAHRDRQVFERERAADRWEDGDLVFANEVGAPLHGPTVTRHLQAHLVTAGLPRWRFHDLRHAAASLMLAQGVPARVVMETLGHSTIYVTMNTYTHVVPELQREAADRMGAFLDGS